MPVVVTLTTSVIVEMSIGDTADALVRAWAGTAKSWVTDWVASGIVHEILTGFAGIVGVTDTSTVHVLGGVWNAGNTVIVGTSTASSITSVITGIIGTHVTGESTEVHVALTSTELIEMSVDNTANTVHVGWARTSAEAFWMTVLSLVVWLGIVDLAALTNPVGIACAVTRVVTRGMICAVSAVGCGWAGAAEAKVITLVGSTVVTEVANIARVTYVVGTRYASSGITCSPSS